MQKEFFRATATIESEKGKATTFAERPHVAMPGATEIATPPGNADIQLAAAREKLHQPSLETVLAAEGEPLPSMPTITELGTSATKESAYAEHKRIQGLFSRILNTTPDSRTLPNIGRIQELLDQEITTLTNDPQSTEAGDAQYLTFLNRLREETALIAQKIKENENKILFGEAQEHILRDSYNSTLELLSLFPDQDPHTLLGDEDLIYKLLSERYAIVGQETPWFQTTLAKARAALNTDTLKGGIIVSIGAGAASAGVVMGQIAWELGSVNVVTIAYTTIPLFAGGIVVTAGSMRALWGYRERISKFKLEQLRKIKEKVWNNWFPKNPTPQVEKIAKS